MTEQCRPGTAVLDLCEYVVHKLSICSYFGTVQVFAIGITSDIDEIQLRAISSPPHELGRTYITTPDFTTLSQLLDRLITATCVAEKPDLSGIYFHLFYLFIYSRHNIVSYIYFIHLFS